MATIVMAGGQGPMKRWDASCFDCCSAGICTCLYVAYCPCCAAGDVATAAGKDYCCTCCLVPVLLPCLLPCQLNSDRAALALRYNIDDDLGGCCSCMLFYCGYHCCLLIQELNQIKNMKQQGQGGYTVVMQAPQQQVMAGYQGGYPQQQYQQQQGGYPPQQYQQPQYQQGYGQTGGYQQPPPQYQYQQGPPQGQQGGYPPQQYQGPPQGQEPTPQFAPQQQPAVTPQFMNPVAPPKSA